MSDMLKDLGITRQELEEMSDEEFNALLAKRMLEKFDADVAETVRRNHGH